MTKSKKITTIVIVAGVVLYTLYDIIVAVTGNVTLSEVIRNAAFKAPMIPFAVGVLIGHWFFGKTPEDK